MHAVATPDDGLRAVITEVQPGPAAPGPLHGLRLMVKDLFDTAGIRTTYGSKIYEDHVPALTASAVRRLTDAGAVIVGKANLDEFAWGVTGQNPWYGTIVNPKQPGRIAGGSSGGSAAALAAGLCDIALGTDTGGSIRIPSACCGTVGLKTQWGRIPRDGVFPLCPTFDSVGPMATSVRDVALVWSVLAAAPSPPPRLAGLTVGLLTRPPSFTGAPVPENRAAEAYVDQLEALGARVVPAAIPAPAADTFPLFLFEAARSHAETFPSRTDEYGPNIRHKLTAAQAVEPDAVASARDAVTRWRAFEPPVDLYVCPCIGGELPPDDCDELVERDRLCAFMRAFNMLGWAGLAIGDLQLAAPTDEVVLAAGLAWERAAREEGAQPPARSA